jgi:hypothetical protein
MILHVQAEPASSGTARMTTYAAPAEKEDATPMFSIKKPPKK